jgi:hypothetical protein
MDVDWPIGLSEHSMTNGFFVELWVMLLVLGFDEKNVRVLGVGVGADSDGSPPHTPRLSRRSSATSLIET